MLLKTEVSILSTLIGLVFLVSPVLAQGNRPSAPPSFISGLSNASMRSCQARESAVKKQMQGLTNLATNMENVFDSIALRVEKFYKDEILPTGKTVANYDALAKDISTKKGMVDTDLSAAKDVVNSFSCTSGNPKSLLTNFRINMQKVKQDLQNYRTTIRNLIVAVRGVSPSPEPSKSPGAVGQ